MLKRLGTVMTVCLLVIVGTRMASAVTTFDNGISKFVLNDYGVVTEAYYLGNPTNNFLAGGELNFGIIFDTPSGVSNTIWLENPSLSMNRTGYIPTENRATFIGSYGLGVGQSMSVGVEFKLQAGKQYMDIRYSVGANGVDIEDARVYFYLKPAVGSSLALLTTPEEKAAWQMAQDTANYWKVSDPWWLTPYPDVFVAGGVAFSMKTGYDDYESGNAATIKDNMNNGLSLGNVVNQYPSNPAWGLRYPTSPANINIDNGNTLYMDARLETAPEPSTMCLMLTGLLGVAGVVRRRFTK